MKFLTQLRRLLLALLGLAPPPTPPGAPPAAAFRYVSPDFAVQEAGDCADGSRVWVYRPATVAKKPGGGADVVIYLHGYSAVYPFIYERHLEHLVRQGNTVLYPQFQEGACLDDAADQFFSGLALDPASPADWAERAASATRDALDGLSIEYDHAYLYGHSLGGAIAMMWGALSSEVNVTAAVLASPQPAGFAAIPGPVTTLLPFLFGEDIDVPAAAPSTKFPVAVLHGSEDTVAPLSDIYSSYDALGSPAKAIYQAQTDRHGSPSIAADHFAPTSIGFLGESDVDTLDWRYYWSALDQVMEGVSVTDLDFDLGTWSDGVKVQSVSRMA